MYEAFFGLREKPFSLLPDPDFLYLSKKHQEALTLLEYGLLNQAGFIVLTGEVGSGKTTLMRYLLDRLDEDVTVGLIANTHESLGDLIDWICQAFNIHSANSSKLDLHQRFIDFLIDQYSQGRRTLLIVDEAQNLGIGKLEELRLLSNINAEKDLILQLMLLGQPQLRELLGHPDLEQFVQRVSASYHLGRLVADDTERYIRHRVAIAGAEDEIFTAEACAAIHHYSNGVPRLINLICDTTLVYAYGAGQPQVTRDGVDEFVASQAQHLLIPIERAGTANGGAPDQGSGGKAHWSSSAPQAGETAAQETSADEWGSLSYQPSSAQGPATPAQPPLVERAATTRAPRSTPDGIQTPASSASGAKGSAPHRPPPWPTTEPEVTRTPPRQAPGARRDPTAGPEAGDVSSDYAPRRRALPGRRHPHHQLDADLYIVGEPDPPRPPPGAKSRIIVLASLLAVLAIAAGALWLGGPSELGERLRTLLLTSATPDTAPVDADGEGEHHTPPPPEGKGVTGTPSPAEPSPPAATETPGANPRPTGPANGLTHPAQTADRGGADTPGLDQSGIDASQTAGTASSSAATRPTGGGRPQGISPSPSPIAARNTTPAMSQPPLETDAPTNPASRDEAANAPERLASEPAPANARAEAERGASAAARPQAPEQATRTPEGRTSAAPDAERPVSESVSTTDQTDREGPRSDLAAAQATRNPSITALARRLRDLSVDVEVTSEDRLSVDLGKSVQFEIGSAQLDFRAKDKLTEIAAVLSEFRETSVRVIGHTDTTGRDSVNEWLSTQRAAAVADFLASAGVSTARLSHEGRGESDLKVDPEEELIRGPWVNRRIELEIQQGGQRTPG